MAIILLLILGFFILLWSYYSRLTTHIGAPFVPMEPSVVLRVINLARLKKGDVFYDLGSGDGRLVIAAATKGAKAYGIELDPIRVFYSRICIFLFGLSKTAKIIQKDLFDADLRNADVITIFLLQETNEKLLKKFDTELKKGARIISYAFTLPGWKREMVDINSESVYGPIYVYKKS